MRRIPLVVERSRRNAAASAFAVLLCAVGLAAAVLAGIVRLVTVRHQWLIVASSLTPWVLLFALLCVVGCAALRRWLLAALTLSVLVIASLGQIPLYSRDSSAPANFVVFTANLRLGSAAAADVVRRATQDNATVVLLQELTPQERVELHTAGLDKNYPYSIAAPGAGASGTGLWSRLPISAAQRHPGFAFAEISAQLRVPGTARPTTVFSLHMAAPWPQDPGGYLYSYRLLGPLLRSAPSNDSVVVGGDFNATWDNAQFRSILTAGYHDATDDSGSGFVPTYPGDRAFPPVIGIDHVLTRDATASAVRSVDVPGSDHRGLVAGVTLP